MEKERAQRSLKKLEKRMEEARKLGFHEKYSEVFNLASDYTEDSGHYYSKGDYFSSFGCSDYAYGLIDALLIIEGKKEDYPE
jgi:hypothetical protein